MAKKTEILEEMKGQARVFRIDRDSLIIYTGRDKADLQPFIRVGAGDNIPHGLLKHIENVVIPDAGIWNLGLEMAWQDASLKQGVDHIQYVGAKDMVSQVYLYTRFSEKDEEYHRKTVKLLPYKKVPLSNEKERSLINFFTNGNMNIQVNGSKVVDYENFIRSKINLDKEYDLMLKSQKKLPLRGKDGVGFVFFGTEDGITPSMLWNLEGNGLFMNPTHEYPYALFENMLDVDNLFMVTTSNPYGSGFVEAFRRKDCMNEPISAYCPFPEQALSLKKIYKNAAIQYVDDAKALPKHKNTTYYVSKSGSHALFAMKLAEKVEEPVKILFPLGLGRKQTKNFDYVKAPFNLEFATVSNPLDAKVNSLTHMMIHFQGNMKPQAYINLKLEECSLPVIQGAEYKMHYTENHNSIAESFSASLAGSGFEETVPELFRYILAGKQEDAKLREILMAMRKTKVPQSVIHRFNLHEFFRFIKNQPAYGVSLKPIFQKTIDRIQDRFAYRKLKVKDLVSLDGLRTEVEIIFDAGIATYAVIRDVERNYPFPIQFPPESAAFELLEGEYKALLKQNNKILDKMDVEAPGFRSILEMMEKIFEDRREMVKERNRLAELLAELGMSFIPEVEKKTFLSYLPGPVQNFIRSINLSSYKEKVFSKIEPFVENVRNLRAAFFLLPLVLFFAAGIYFLSQNYNGISSGSATAGIQDSAAAEINAQKPIAEQRDEAQNVRTDVPDSASLQTAAKDDEGGFFSMIAGWFSSDDTTAMNGFSEDEMKAVSPPVMPGEIQADAFVPGEDAVHADPSEIMQYANALATKNGFTTIHNTPAGDLRNPDMVYPGDILELPDGRLLKITNGQTIWKVAGRSYKKDFARVLILERQILSSGDAKKKSSLLKLRTV